MLRLLQLELDAEEGEKTWWRPPEWNRRKQHRSILGLRRLLCEVDPILWTKIGPS